MEINERVCDRREACERAARHQHNALGWTEVEGAWNAAKRAIAELRPDGRFDHLVSELDVREQQASREHDKHQSRARRYREWYRLTEEELAPFLDEYDLDIEDLEEM